MSENIDLQHYGTLKEEFRRVCKRVLKTNLTANASKHEEYLTDLVLAYNAIIAYVSDFYENFADNRQEAYKKEWIYFRDKILLVFGKLNISHEPPTDFFILLEIDNILHNYRENNPEVTNETTMALTSVDFIRIAAQTINHNYDGNPLGLNSFINSVKLLQELSNDNVRGIFVRFVKSKLEGKALETIPENANDVDEIIAALKNQIRPDNSKVIAGRLLALKPDRAKLVEFSEQAEKLADALQRSLIIEGISQAKAGEMSIEKTVEVCRSAARSDLVKSVLASTKFESPKEVIAKYIVESSTEEREKQILAYRAYQKQNKRGNRYNGNNNNQTANRGRNNNRNGNGGRNNRYGNGGRNNYNNNSQNRNGNGRNGYNENNRGRNQSYNNNGGNRSNNDNNRNVRYTENCEAPQLQLGEAQNRN